MLLFCLVKYMNLMNKYALKPLQSCKEPSLHYFQIIFLGIVDSDDCFVKDHLGEII